MKEPSARDRALDEDLSALLDGELDEARAGELRAMIAAEPALAARLAELESVGARLRELPLPSDTELLRAGLQQKIDAESRAGAAPSGGRSSSRAAWAAGMSLAAALALYLVLGPSRSSSPGGGTREDAPADPMALLEIPDDELAIALDYEALRDFDLIDQLELLEALADSEDSEIRG